MSKIIKLIFQIKLYFFKITPISALQGKRIVNRNNLKAYSNLPWFLDKRVSVKGETGVFSGLTDLSGFFDIDLFNSNNLVLRKDQLSILICRILNAMDYKPKMLILFDGFSIGTYCFFEHKDELVIFNNTCYYNKYDSIDDVLDVYDHDEYIIYDPK